jgi:L-ascorbate metabolism protein UlaG (beta-lactamase superfamily)
MDPFSSDSVGFSMSSVDADIVTVSHQHQDHNQTDLVKGSPVVFDFPGEYEVKGVKVFGYSSYHDDEKGEKRGENIIFQVQINNVVLTHMGDIGHLPDAELISQLENTDVLLVPVGGIYTVSAEKAVKIVEMIKPSITIPMHYQTDKHNEQFKELSPLSEFLKLMGKENTEPQPKLEIKSQEDLPENDLVVLSVSK